MPVLHVRNVPDDLHTRLQRRAQEKNRSLSAEVITLLSRALDEAEPGQAETLQGIGRRRFYRPAQHNAPDTTTLLREDRGR